MGIRSSKSKATVVPYCDDFDPTDATKDNFLYGTLDYNPQV